MTYIVLFIGVIIIGLMTWFLKPDYFSTFTDYVSNTTDTLISSDSAAMQPISLTRDIARKADLSALQVALLQYRIENSIYPKSISDLFPDFIGEIPTDPQTNKPYDYSQLNDGKSYKLCILWETSENGDSCITLN